MHQLLHLVRYAAAPHLRAWLLLDMAARHPQLVLVPDVRVALLRCLLAPFAYRATPASDNVQVPTRLEPASTGLCTLINAVQLHGLADVAARFFAEAAARFSPEVSDMRDAFLFCVRLIHSVGSFFPDGLLAPAARKVLGDKLRAWEVALLRRTGHDTEEEFVACLAHSLLLGPHTLRVRHYVCCFFHFVSAYSALPAPSLDQRELAVVVQRAHAIVLQTLEEESRLLGMCDYMQGRFPNADNLWHQQQAQSVGPYRYRLRTRPLPVSRPIVSCSPTLNGLRKSGAALSRSTSATQCSA